jgi:hypothetical protein
VAAVLERGEGSRTATEAPTGDEDLGGQFTAAGTDGGTKGDFRRSGEDDICDHESATNTN